MTVLEEAQHTPSGTISPDEKDGSLRSSSSFQSTATANGRQGVASSSNSSGTTTASRQHGRGSSAAAQRPPSASVRSSKKKDGGRHRRPSAASGHGQGVPPAGRRASTTSASSARWWRIRFFQGMINDLKRRLPYYWSDWKDAWDYRVVPATIYMYFAKYVVSSDARLIARSKGWQALTLQQHPSSTGLLAGHVREDQ